MADEQPRLCEHCGERPAKPTPVGGGRPSRWCTVCMPFNPKTDGAAYARRYRELRADLRERNRRLNKARGRAMRRLVTRHQAEYAQLYDEERARVEAAFQPSSAV